jgi:hypothetical protein
MRKVSAYTKKIVKDARDLMFPNRQGERYVAGSTFEANVDEKGNAEIVRMCFIGGLAHSIFKNRKAMGQLDNFLQGYDREDDPNYIRFAYTDSCIHIVVSDPAGRDAIITAFECLVEREEQFKKFARTGNGWDTELPDLNERWKNVKAQYIGRDIPDDTNTRRLLREMCSVCISYNDSQRGMTDDGAVAEQQFMGQGVLELFDCTEECAIEDEMTPPAQA